jgi:membrane protein implicated in regulation of membrane protease activity
MYALPVIAAAMVLANPSAFLRWGLAGEIIFLAILAIVAYFLVEWLRRARRD